MLIKLGGSIDLKHSKMVSRSSHFYELVLLCLFPLISKHLIFQKSMNNIKDSTMK